MGGINGASILRRAEREITKRTEGAVSGAFRGHGEKEEHLSGQGRNSADRERGSQFDRHANGNGAYAQAGPRGAPARAAEPGAAPQHGGGLIHPPAPSSQPSGPNEAQEQKLLREVEAFIKDGKVPNYPTLRERREWFERADAATGGNMVTQWGMQHGMYEAYEKGDVSKQKELAVVQRQLLSQIYGEEAVNKYVTTLLPGLVDREQKGSIPLSKALQRLHQAAQKDPRLVADTIAIANHVWRGISVDDRSPSATKKDFVDSFGRDVTIMAMRSGIPSSDPIVGKRIAHSHAMAGQVEQLLNADIPDNERAAQIGQIFAANRAVGPAILYALREKMQAGQWADKDQKPYTINSLMSTVFGNEDIARAALGVLQTP